MTTQTLYLRDADGNKYKAKFTLDGDGETLIPNLVVDGLSVNIDIDSDTPLPVHEEGDALTALQALASTISSGNLKVILQAGANAIGKLTANAGVNIGEVSLATLAQAALDAINTATTALATTVATGRLNVTVAAAVQTALDAINTATTLVGTTVGSGRVNVTVAAAVQTALDAINTATTSLATTVSSTNLKVLLQAGSAAIGKLAANSGVIIGAVEIAASQTVALAAGSAAFGKLAANTAATYIGDVVLQASTAAIGKLSANSGVDIGDVDVTSVAPASALGGSDTGSVGSTATRYDSATSHVCQIGVWITNTHATQVLYGGGSNTDTTHFIFALYQGERIFLPIANTNLLYLYGSAGSTTYAIGWL